MSGPVGATRRTTAERVESTVELCRSDKSTGRYDSKTVKRKLVSVPRRVASGWTRLDLAHVSAARAPVASLSFYRMALTYTTPSGLVLSI